MFTVRKTIFVTLCTAILISSFFQPSLRGMAVKAVQPTQASPAQIFAQRHPVLAGGICAVVLGLYYWLVVPASRANWKLYQNSKFINAAAQGATATVRSYLKAGYSPIVCGEKKWKYTSFLQAPDPFLIWAYGSIGNSSVTMQKINEGHGAGSYRPFYEAVYYGHSDIVEQMLQHKCFNDQKVKREVLDNALRVAIQARHREVALTLVVAGADLPEQDKYDRTTLHYKVYDQYRGPVDAFAKSFKAEYIKYRKIAPLIRAIKSGDLAQFTQLFNALPDGIKKYSLEFTFNNGLLDIGIVSGHHFDSLLLAAIYAKRRDIVEFLYQSSVAINEKTMFKALKLAEILEDEATVVALMRHRAHEIEPIMGQLLKNNPFVKKIFMREVSPPVTTGFGDQKLDDLINTIVSFL